MARKGFGGCRTCGQSARLSVTSLQRVPCPLLGPAFPLPTQSLPSEDFQSSLSVCLVITCKKIAQVEEYDQLGPSPWASGLFSALQ